MASRDVNAGSHAELMESIRTMLKTSAAMYMYLTEEAIRAFGFRGERAVRQHLRSYGTWRGTEMRAAHQALSLPIDVETLLRHWDSASGYATIDEKKASFSPNKVLLDVSECPAGEVWRASNFWRWGHVYCDELHQACTAAYNPDACVVIPQNIMKGDPSCKFTWVMAPGQCPPRSEGRPELGRKLAAQYLPSSESDAAMKALRRGARLHGGRFLTFLAALEDAFGSDGVEVARVGLRKWSSYRGRLLRNRHDSLAIERSIATVFQHHDLPYRYVWDYRVELSPTDMHVEVVACPLADVARDLGAEKDMYVYCCEAYAPLFQEYGLDEVPRLASCLCGGESSCVFEVRRAEANSRGMG